jgi:hypothetical protein
VHGHIADSVRDHEPGRGVGSFPTRRRSKRFTEPLAPGFRRPTVLGEEPARPPDDHWWSDSPALAWPTRSAGSRENPVAGYRGVALDWGGTVPPGGVALHLRYHAGGVRRQAAPAGPRVVCRMQRPATDEPRPPAGRCGAAAAPVSADLSLTCDVPAVDLSRTSRDGTDDGERSKGPVTCAVLTMPVRWASSAHL